MAIGTPSSYPFMSQLNNLKKLGSGWDPIQPFGKMSHIPSFKASLEKIKVKIKESIENKQKMSWAKLSHGWDKLIRCSNLGWD